MRGGRIHLLGKSAECDAALYQIRYDPEEMGQRAPDTALDDTPGDEVVLKKGRSVKQE